MSEAQALTLLAAACLACCLTAAGYLRGRRMARVARYDSELSFATQRKTARTAPQDIVLRDALYLVRRHLAELPTSRRQSSLPERTWQQAIRLCRSAELLDAKGRWHVVDYPTAFAALQRASRGAAQRAQPPNYVSAYEQDW
jgi:hypothetical protein